MTATSVLTPTSVTRSWTAVQRTVAVLFAIAVFVAIAFAAGRIERARPPPFARDRADGLGDAGGWCERLSVPHRTPLLSKELRMPPHMDVHEKFESPTTGGHGPVADSR